MTKWLPWIAVASVLGLCLVGLAAGSFFESLFAQAALLILLLVLARPPLILIATTLLMTSEWTLPFMPSGQGLYLVTGLLFCGAVVLQRIFFKAVPVSRAERWILYWTLGFLFVLVVTASLRGWGVKALKSEMWGGRPYILLILSGLVLTHSLFVKLSPAQCQFTLVGFCLAGLFPTLAAMASHYFGFEGLSRMQAQADEAGQSFSGLVGALDPMYRLQVANVGSTFLFLLMWLVMAFRNMSGRLLVVACGIGALVLTGISGHRISLLYGIVLSVAYALLNVKISLLTRLMNRYLFLLLAVLAVLVVISPRLPIMFQRSLSWIPGADVSATAQFDAAVTSMWRIEVWKRAMEELPRYLLIGKGFAFRSDDFYSYVNWTMNDYSFVLTSRNYHNGVIQILMDLGLPGILCALGFIVTVFRRHYRLLSAKWNSERLSHFHRVMLAGFSAQIVVYLIVGGGVTTFVTLFFWTALLVQLARADGDAAPPPPRAVPPA